MRGGKGKVGEAVTNLAKLFFSMPIGENPLSAYGSRKLFPTVFDMETLSKFSASEQASARNYTHPDIWERQNYPGWSRLAIGPRLHEIPLLLDLCKNWDGPFGVLYVLSAPRTIETGGRFQSPHPVSYEDLELFLYSFQEFFEQDGRHDIWVISLPTQNQLILDRHNVIYAYGNLDTLERALEEREFSPAPIETPVPHTHHYHPEFDTAERELLTYWDWIQYELLSSDEV